MLIGKDRPGKWYILRTAPQADSLAVSELQRNGFEVFAPRVKSAYAASGQADAPLFPGYIFLKWDLENAGTPSLDAPHVSGWVKFDGVPPAVPDELIAELDERVETINSEGGLWHRFKPGDEVRVVSRAVESIAQVLEEAKSPRSRVNVLMQFMGRWVSAQVPWESLQPIGDKHEARSRPPRRTRGRGRRIRMFEPRTVGVQA